MQSESCAILVPTIYLVLEIKYDPLTPVLCGERRGGKALTDTMIWEVPVPPAKTSVLHSIHI